MQPEPGSASPAVAAIDIPAQPLSFEAYNAVIERLTPQEVRLSDLTFSLKSGIHSGPLQAVASMSEPAISERMDGSEGAVFVTVEHRVTFKLQASDESVAAEGRAIFHVRLKLGFNPPEEFWPIFLLRNIKLYTHPALRDLLASLSARAGFIVLPLSSVSVTQALKKD